MRIRTLLAILLSGGVFMLCLAGCGGAPAETPSDAVLSFDSFDGGGPEFTVRIDDPSVVGYTAERDYHKRNHAELDGASYTDRFTFTGLKAGQTTVTVQARSPIADEYDAVYAVTVDETLHVSIEEISRTYLTDPAVEIVEEPVE